MGNSGLPSLSTPFIGRDAELAEIRQLLADPSCRLLSLVGLGGIGKTRLAVEAAKQNHARFPDGIFFVPLQPLESPEQILSAITEVTRIGLSPGIDPKEQLVGFFGEKRILLVLDSFEHLLPGTGAVIDLLHNVPEVKFLVTSREKLKLQNEAVVYIGPLTYPDQEQMDRAEQYTAVTMLLSLLHRLVPELAVTPDVLADTSLICRQVQGLPLAIELAAGWADVLSLQEIAQEIARSFDFLEAQMHDSSERHRNIRAVLDPSVETLSDVDCAVWEKLCIFRSSFNREAAEAVAGATLPSLARLVNKSLIHHLPSGRYEIHELVRRYGEARLNNRAGQPEAARERYCAYYADFLKARWQEMKSTMGNIPLERIDVEITNIKAAFHSMIENKSVAHIWLSMNALWNYFAFRSRHAEGAFLFGKSAEALRTSQSDEALTGSLLVRQAFFLAGLGTLSGSDEAIHLAEEGLRMLEYHQHPESTEALIIAYLCLSIIYEFWREATRAMRMKEVAEKGLALATANNHTYGIRYHMGFLAHAECKLGNYVQAKEIGDRCYRLAVSHNDSWLCGMMARLVLGEAAYVRNDYEEAQEWCQIALQCFDNLLEPWTHAQTSLMLTNCAIALGNFAGAHKHLQACLRMLEESGLVWEIPAILLNVAQRLADQQMCERAVAILPLILHHPACRQVTSDEVTVLLRQLETALPARKFKAAWAWGQERQPAEVLDPLITPQNYGMRSSPDDLSTREVEVLRLISDGLSNAEIAQQLCMSIGTVKVHTRHIYDKLGVNSRTQAAKSAQEMGIL